MNFKNQLFLGLMILLSTGCRSSLPKSGLSDVSSSSVYFQLPSCLPNCSAADQSKLAAESMIEKKIVNLIDSAQSSIQFSMYTFSRKPIFEALVAAAQRGVTIQGIMDRAQFKTTSTFCKAASCSVPASDLGANWDSLDINARMTRVLSVAMYKDGSNTDKLVLLLTGLPSGSGVRPLPGSDRLVHNKYVLVDGKHLLSGSGNWSSTAVSVNLENLVYYTSADYKDVIDGTACSFNLLWQGNPDLIAKSLGACQKDNAFYLSPSGTAKENPESRIIKAIEEASAHVNISMHHLTDPEIFDALEASLKRGVEVRLAVDDDDCNAKPDQRIEQILTAGAKIKYVPTTCSIFQLSHSKYGIFDNKLVINGSANWSKAGLKKNYENFVVLSKDDMVSSFNDNFAKIWSLAQDAKDCQCDLTTEACKKKYCIP